MKKVLLAVGLAVVSTSTIASQGNEILSGVHKPIEPQTEVAKEYVELGKLYSLHPDLASIVVDVNIGMAYQCGLTVTWPKLFEDYRFRNYSSLVRSQPNENNTKTLDSMVESLCNTLTRKEIDLKLD